MAKKVEEAMVAAQAGNGTLVGYDSTKLSGLLNNYKLQIQQALPKHLSAERIIQIATIVISRNPSLKECTASSVIGAVMQASILGFKPVESLGQCYLVPYNRKLPDGTWIKECQFQIGYKGYIDLSQRTGKIKMLYAYCVYQGDHFDYALGLEPYLEHKRGEGDRTDFGKITHAYAVAHLMNGGFNFYVLTRKEIEALRLRNTSQKNGVAGSWKTDFPEMACAKAVKKLSKFLPMSDEMMAAVITDEKTITPDAFTTDQSGTIADAPYTEVSDEQGLDIEVGKIGQDTASDDAKTELFEDGKVVEAKKTSK